MMLTNIDKLMDAGCSSEKKDKVCRSRGGESCAFDGAMIVLQPIKDTAHLVHGPIACCGNSWEGRGTFSRNGSSHVVPLYKMGFTTDINELDIVYGAEKKLAAAIRETHAAVRPKAIFVYATCVSGLIGEDLEAVCRDAESELGIRVIPISAPGFVGPKNLGNRIAGEALLEHVIGAGTPPVSTDHDVNLIGEYNIAGDLWLVEPVLRKAGLRVLSRMTGDATFEEITWAHTAKLNVVVCGRALINVAKGMRRKYGIPYAEVSFFGKTEMTKALRLIGRHLSARDSGIIERIESVIAEEEHALEEKLKPYARLKGRKAVLYTGGVKSWSFISALRDLGLEIVAVGVKKSTAEDEEKMRELLGQDAPLVSDVTPGNLKRLLRERHADILIAGGRNQYLAIKEGYPFVDVNQERHTAYAGYAGLVNLAEQISSAIMFYERHAARIAGSADGRESPAADLHNAASGIVINPLKHSASIGAAIALQGVHNALPVLHGAQGCAFLAKVLLTKHFREPIALAGTKLFAEDVVMGSEENLLKTVRGYIDKESPSVVAVLTSGLTEVKGDDCSASVKSLNNESTMTNVVHVPTPDYEGGLEEGYARAVLSLAEIAGGEGYSTGRAQGQVTILAGSHLTPADFLELREMTEAMGLRPIIIPDLAALDGSRQGISALAKGGTGIQELASVGYSEFNFVIGRSLEPSARLLEERFGTAYRVFDSLAGIQDTDCFMEALAALAGRPLPERFERRRRVLIDSMRDAQFSFAGKKVCLALEADHALQTSRWLREMGADVTLAVVPTAAAAARRIAAARIVVGDLQAIRQDSDLIVANSHAATRARTLGVPLMHAGFPVFSVIGYTNKITIGYRGTLSLIQEAANLLAKEVH